MEKDLPMSSLIYQEKKISQKCTRPNLKVIVETEQKGSGQRMINGQARACLS